MVAFIQKDLVSLEAEGSQKLKSLALKVKDCYNYEKQLEIEGQRRKERSESRKANLDSTSDVHLWNLEDKDVLNNYHPTWLKDF